MKIFSAEQIRNWDAYTIMHEPIASVDLMERAAKACVAWIKKQPYQNRKIQIFCGTGNNGGDGLAIARMLLQENYSVFVYIARSGTTGSVDFQTNLKRLQESGNDPRIIEGENAIPQVSNDNLVIDALLGTGLNKPLQGLYKLLVDHLNKSGASILSIDVPSGLFADASSRGNTIIEAAHTLTFQAPKLAFLLPENEKFVGTVHILNIGLADTFEATEPGSAEIIDEPIIRSIYKPRTLYSHKGTFGHAGLICGSRGMMGAAVLSSRACLRSGAGKLTAFVPSCGYLIMQTTVPEAMCIVTGEDFHATPPGLDRFEAIGIGPGIGNYPTHEKLIGGIFNVFGKPMVLDADALNVLAENRQLLLSIPPFSILTPHLKEFEKLFGKAENDFARLELAGQMSIKYQVYIILKGHNSFISTPDGHHYFNSTGNAGMATAGSGDVLTGVLTGLLAQGYSPFHTCLLGVYLQGLAGDLASDQRSQEAMIAGDIIDFLGAGYKLIAGL